VVAASPAASCYRFLFPLTREEPKHVVVGLGVDLVELDRVERALSRWGGRLVAKLMGAAEARRLPASGAARTRALACAIAAKEAASKSIGTGWSRGVRWCDVVVELAPAPRVTLEGRAAEVARTLGSRGASRTRLEVRDNLVLAEVRLLR
jgi:holo-[acyl-carrier protein] synthase